MSLTDALKIYCGAPKELAYNSRSTGSKQVLLMIDAMKQTALIGLGSSLRVETFVSSPGAKEG
jgi:hypothetical protein